MDSIVVAIFVVELAVRSASLRTSSATTATTAWFTSRRCRFDRALSAIAVGHFDQPATTLDICYGRLLLLKPLRGLCHRVGNLALMSATVFETQLSPSAAHWPDSVDSACAFERSLTTCSTDGHLLGHQATFDAESLCRAEASPLPKEAVASCDEASKSYCAFAHPVRFSCLPIRRLRHATPAISSLLITRIEGKVEIPFNLRDGV